MASAFGYFAWLGQCMGGARYDHRTHASRVQLHGLAYRRHNAGTGIRLRVRGRFRRKIGAFHRLHSHRLQLVKCLKAMISLSKEFHASIQHARTFPLDLLRQQLKWMSVYWRQRIVVIREEGPSQNLQRKVVETRY